MKAEYRRDAKNNYLVLEAPENTDREMYSIRMIENNKIPGLLPMHSSLRDGALFFYYEITSRQSLESLYEKKKLECIDMINILSGIQETLQALRRYLIPADFLLFEPESIFLSPDTGRVLLCCYPGENPESSILSLADFFLRRLEHQDGQAVALGYGLYQRASEKNISIQRLLEELLKNYTHEKKDSEPACEKEPPGRIPAREKEEQAAPSDPSEKPSQKVIRQTADPFSQPPQSSSREKKGTFWLFQKVHPAILLSVLAVILGSEILLFFGIFELTEAGGLFFMALAAGILSNNHWKKKKDEKDKASKPLWSEEDEEDDSLYQELHQEMYQENHLESSSQETSLLVSDEETRCLVSNKSFPVIRLITSCPGCPQEIFPSPEPVLIGKSQGIADILLPSDTVSRIHASLEMENHKYYIRDRNSKNGTFVNGVRLQINERKEFKEGDCIAFADIVYHAVKRDQ